MPTEEEERKAKAERAKKLLAKRKAKATSSSTSTPIPPTSPTPSSGDVLQSTRTSLSVDDRVSIDAEAPAHRIPPPPKGPARSKISSPVIPEPEESINGVLESSSAPGKQAQVEHSAEERQEISALIQEREDLLSQLLKRDEELKDLGADRKLLEEGKIRIAELESEKKELCSRLESLEKDTKELQGLKVELLSKQDKLDDITKSRKTLEDELVASKQRETDAKQKAEDESAGIRRDLERAREREGSLEAEIGKLRQSNSTLKSDLETRTAEIETLRTASDRASTDLKSLQSEHSKLQSQHKSLRSEQTDLQTSLKSLQTEFDTLKASSSKSSSQIASTESSLTASKTALDKVKTSLSAETKKLENIEKKRQALQDENSSLYTQLEEVRGKVSSVMQEKADLVTSLDDYKKKEKILHERLSSLEGDKVNGPSPGRSKSRARDEPESSTSARRISQLETELTNLQSSYRTMKKERDVLLSNPNYLSPNADPSHQFRNTPSSPRLNNDIGLGNVNRGMDAILPANVRHKRQVSLTALKARMGASSGTLNKLESLNEDPGGTGATGGHTAISGRKQFGDEIVFCCPACEGDLITL